MRKSMVFLIVLVLGLSAAGWSQSAVSSSGSSASTSASAKTSSSRLIPQCIVMAVSVPPPHMLDSLGRQLELTEDQTKRVKAILEKASSKIEPLMDKWEDAVKAAQTALFTPGTDAASVRDLTEKAEKAEAVIAAAELDTWFELKPILKDEQINKIGDMVLRALARPSRPPAGGKGKTPSGGTPNIVPAVPAPPTPVQ